MPSESTKPTDTDWVFKQFLYEDVLRDLDNHFQRLNIDYMPIKGAYLICAGLAQQLKTRTMFDIDLLVREKDFDAVISYFTNLPGVAIVEKSWPIYKKGWPFEVSMYYPFEGRTINIDIHKLINLRQRFLLPPEALFARGSKQGLRRTLPCAEDALAICLCHGFSHIAHVFSKHVFDDIAALTSASVNWIIFREIAESTGISAFMYYALKLCQKERGAPLLPFEDATVRRAYADLLLTAFSGRRSVHALPKIARRLFLELPFCRDPIGLMIDKCGRILCK